MLDCMSTVPLLMMSRSSTAHSVVCWVLRCTVSNIPPTWREREREREGRAGSSFLRTYFLGDNIP